MNRFILCSSICLIIFFIIVLNIFQEIGKQKENEEKKYINCLGENIVIVKDTLTVVDYNMFTEKFSLSNGQNVSKELVFNILKKQ